MAIDRNKLAAHLKDFQAVTGVWLDRFFCPFTGQEIEERELINGHILNESIKDAPRRTVIQWGKIDHHYGAHVEPPLVEHIEFLHMSGAERIGSAERTIRLADGTMVEAHLATSATGMHMAKKFAVMDVEEYDGTVRPYALKGVDPADPRLLEGDDRRLVITSEFLHEHHNAAALKAGFLLLFDLFGYRIAFSRVMLPVRQKLSEFFEKKLTFRDVPNHFKEFMGALTPVRGWTDAPAEATDAGLDSIGRREFLALLNAEGDLFSLGVVLPVGKVWLVVWMPFGNPMSDRELNTLHDHYLGFIRDELRSSYTLHPARLRIDSSGHHQLDLGPAKPVQEVDYVDIAEAVNRRAGRTAEPPLVPGDDALIRHFEAKRRRR